LAFVQPEATAMIECHPHANDILEIRLARPPVNALHPALLTPLRAALEQAPRDGARGIVLSGSPGIFSAGLDVPYLLTLERADLERAWRSFFDVCAVLAHSPLPVVAALTGHAPAGGAVLGLFCDYRVMAAGEFRIGLNEVQVGLVVPECIQHALRRIVGTYRAERLMVAGAMIESAEAARIGMVDELALPERVLPRSIEWLQELLALPPQAMLRTRQLARADLTAAIDDPAQLRLDVFLDAWFGEETQRVLRALVARLKAKG
jgi:Delta3-Delta2-enoyl-CoA isomerase